MSSRLQIFGRSLAVAFAVYYLTSFSVVVGFWFSWKYVRPPMKAFQRPVDRDLLDGVTHWDGRWYLRIAEEGYYYDPGTASSVAFFPAYPLAGRLTATTFDIDPRIVCFMSGARFAVVILPFFVIIGRVVGRLPSPAAALAIGVAMTSLLVFSMEFMADFWVF